MGDQVIIPFGEGRAFRLQAGRTLYVRQRERGGQVGDLNVWNLADTREHLWSSRTALYHGMHLTTGDQLHSTWPGERPILSIVEDTIAGRRSKRGALQHDILGGRCSQKYREKRYGKSTPGCQELLAGAVASFGLGPEHVHDAFNLFMNTGIDPDDGLFLEVTDARPGEFIALRAEIDCLIAISSCPGMCTATDATGLLCEVG